MTNKKKYDHTKENTAEALNIDEAGKKRMDAVLQEFLEKKKDGEIRTNSQMVEFIENQVTLSATEKLCVAFSIGEYLGVMIEAKRGMAMMLVRSIVASGEQPKKKKGKKK